MKRLFLILAFLIFFSTSVYGQTEYYETVSVALTWDAVTTCTDESPCTPDHYEIQIVRDSGEKTVYQASGTTLTVSKGKSGKFTVWIKAVMADGTASAYCMSTDSSCSKLKDGTAGGWKVLFRPSAPIGPIIGN